MENPDRSEKKIRFGCGFVFGLVIGFFVVAKHIHDSAGGLAAGTFVFAVVCGLLAMAYGDEFWYSLKKWWWWP